MKNIFISLSLLAASFAQAQTGDWYNYGEVLKYDIGYICKLSKRKFPIK